MSEQEKVVSTEATQEPKTEKAPIIIYSAAFFVQGSDKPVIVSGDSVEALSNVVNNVTNSLLQFVQLAQNADGGPIIINKDKITHIEMYVDQELSRQANGQVNQQPVAEEVSK